ncbi:MAG TPA: TonB-dependent receptor, partial [Pseudorhodoferax sp.]|nr:TonB-dependent receptor [Pseudorhodoferax sp.]
EQHRALVAQARKLYGAEHYNHYDFLFAVTSQLGGIGLEHQRSSENSEDRDYFSGWDAKVGSSDLLGHEYTHSWDGKYRRPADLATLHYNVPMQGSLLWVYEGQTQYWGNVLTARSGIRPMEASRDALALVAATYADNRPGLGWRALGDTTNDPVIARRKPKPYRGYQMSEDYYQGGQMLWLEADVRIRSLSKGRRSLDDFARAFFGINDGQWERPDTYTFEDVAATLEQVQPTGDWARFLRDRLERRTGLTGGIEASGWKLVYGDKPSAYYKAMMKGRGASFIYSLGMSLDSGGKVGEVRWDSPAFDAGLGSGMQVLAVNDLQYSADELEQAVRAAKDGKQPIRLLVKEMDVYRTEIDAGGALNAAGSVRGRVVAATTDRHYFYDIAQSKEPMFYGVVEADLASGTKATAGYRFQEQDIRGYTIFQLPMYSDAGSLGLPRSTSLGQDWNRHTARVHDVFAELEHRFDGDWRGKITLNHVQTDLVQKLNTARGAVNPATGAGTAITSNYFVDRDIAAKGLDAHASGSFQAWGGTHRAMFGGGWSEQEGLSRTTTQSLNIPVDIFHFNHALIPEPLTPAYANQLRERVSLLGLYGSANLELAKPLHLHLGGRLSWYKSHANNALTGVETTNFRQNAQFTPYAGLVYDLGPQWSVYASYTSTFVPQTQYRAFEGGPLSPAEGGNYEAGLKGELLDGRLNVAFSVFKIKKRNVAVVDEAHRGECAGISTSDCYRNASLLRSKGIDIEVGGQLMPGWEISSGFTVLSTRDDAGAPLTADAPQRILRASTSYTLPGAWSDWKLGATVNAQSSSYVVGPPNVVNPGHAVLDLRAAYRINRSWTAALNVGNVFDRTYWSVIGSTRNGNAYGTPRNATLTLRGAF